MNKFLNLLKKTILNTKVILSFVALVFIWHLGPLLAEQYQFTLSSPDFEILSTLALVIAWVFYGVYCLLKSPLQESLLKTQSLHKDAWLNLKLSFDQALNAINHSKPRRLRGRYQRPWILLLGPAESGKTNLLIHSQLHLDNANQKNINTPWHWYLSEQGIFVDVDSNYSLPTQNRIHQSLWNGFLKMVSDYRPQQPFSGVLWVIDLPSLCQSDESSVTLIKQLKKQLLSLQHLKRSIPVTILISKIDLISGFSEFFNDLSVEERKQLLGFMLANSSNPQELTKNFHQQFNHFIAQMSQRLIWRLHQERSLHKRGRLKDFPLQLERLKPFLEKLLQQLPWSIDTELSGIYFCSSMHQSSRLLLTDSSQTSSNSSPLLSSKPYFVYGLLMHLSHASHYEELHQLRKVWRRLGAFPVTAVGLTLAALLMHYVYQKNQEHISEIQTGLKLLANAKENGHHQPWLTQLNILNSSLEKFSHKKNSSSYRWVGMGEAGNLQNKALATYNALLGKNLAPYLQEVLQKQIQKGMQAKRPYTLFSSLKTYLMLTNSKWIDPQYVNHWFANYWAKKFSDDPDYQQQLLTHLAHLMQTSNSLNLDPDLIQEAQNKLQKYPLSEDGLITLEDQYQQTKQPLLSQKHILPGVDFSHANIPSLYDLKNFNAIYDQKIPELITKLKANVWVFGKLPSLPTSTEEESDLVKEIRKSYIEHYAASWKKALYSIQFLTPTDFKTAQESIGNLANSQSTFWRLIQIMVNNASINIRYNKDDPDPNLDTIETYMKGSKEFETTRGLLDNLGLYLNLIAEAHDVNNTAYISAIKHIQENSTEDPLSTLLAEANHLPPPLQHWLKSLAEGSWELILTKAAAYLDYLYSTTVFPEYTLHINNSYPVFKDATNNISLDDFNGFFGPQGTMDTFFNYYIKPFVNTKHFYWKWEKIDGKTLPISQAQLEMFLRAHLIKKMFYSNHENGPSIEFELKPEGLSPHVQQFTLNIAGQVLQFSSQYTEPTIVHWPGPDASFATLRFDATSRKHNSLTEPGVWGWFRLVDKSTLETTHSAKQFKLEFKLDHYTATYKLIAQTAINPYLPNILDKFRLEPSLLEDDQ